MSGQTQNLAQSLVPMTTAKTQFKTLSLTEFTAPNFKNGVIQHIVLFRFKPEVSAEQRKEVFDRFLQLKDKAKRNGKPYITSIKAGAQNTSLEGAGQGFDQAFIVQFRSQGDRNYYVGTPVVT
ncbi:MAG: Dabb family protein, partial [Brucellaceae bacterium]|nr:Dabb family protein [Brucellaceae bacterium]